MATPTQATPLIYLEMSSPLNLLERPNCGHPSNQVTSDPMGSLISKSEADVKWNQEKNIYSPFMAGLQ